MCMRRENSKHSLRRWPVFPVCSVCMAAPAPQRRPRLHFEDKSLQPLDRVRLNVTGGLSGIRGPPTAPPLPTAPRLDFSLEQSYLAEASRAVDRAGREEEARLKRRSEPPPAPAPAPVPPIVPVQPIVAPAPAPDTARVSKRPHRDNAWSCPVCTFDNDLASAVCGVCGGARPPSAAPAPTPAAVVATTVVTGPTPSGGPEWKCSMCTVMNPSNISECHLCGNRRL